MRGTSAFASSACTSCAVACHEHCLAVLVHHDVPCIQRNVHFASRLDVTPSGPETKMMEPKILLVLISALIGGYWLLCCAIPALLCRKMPSAVRLAAQKFPGRTEYAAVQMFVVSRGGLLAGVAVFIIIIWDWHR